MPGKICPVCHQPVSDADYFCPNCGKKLKEAPPLTTVMAQIKVYAVSLFLPPFGLWYAYKYLKEKDPLARKIGMIAVALTVVSSIATIWITKSAINSATRSINQYNIY